MAVNVASCLARGSNGDHFRLVFEEVVLFAKLHRRLTYSNVMATVALFIALGGSSYAVTRIGSSQIINSSIRSEDIGKGQVHSSDILNNDVQGIDIANSAVGTSDVANHSLLASDFAFGQLPAGAQGATGPQGPKGDQGIPGQNGPTGPPGPTAESSAVTTTSVAMTGSFQTVVDLDTVNDGGPGNGGKITTTFPSTLQVAATVEFEVSGTTTNSPNRVTCQMELDSTGFGVNFRQTAPAPNTTAARSMTVATTGAARNVPAGTHNVAVNCSVDAELTFTKGGATLNVVAVP